MFLHDIIPTLITSGTGYILMHSDTIDCAAIETASWSSTFEEHVFVFQRNPFELMTVLCLNKFQQANDTITDSVSSIGNSVSTLPMNDFQLRFCWKGPQKRISARRFYEHTTLVSQVSYIKLSVVVIHLFIRRILVVQCKTGSLWSYIPNLCCSHVMTWTTVPRGKLQ